MGEEVYRRSPTAKQIFYDGSSFTGIDLAEVCFGSQTDRLEETVVAQPAIAAVTLANFSQLLEGYIIPDAGKGHSVGELAILGAAGSLSTGQMFGLIKKRAEITSAAAQERPGMMAVVRNLTIEEVREALSELLRSKRLSIPNLNTSLQHVLSGDAQLVEQARGIIKRIHLKDRLKRKPGFLKLPIQGAFHSEYHMENAVAPFFEALSEVDFREPGFPIMLNNTRYLHELGTDNLPSYLANQLIKGVDFVGGTRRLYQDGMRQFVDIGPKPILGPMVKEEYGEEVEVLNFDQVLESKKQLL